MRYIFNVYLLLIIIINLTHLFAESEDKSDKNQFIQDINISVSINKQQGSNHLDENGDNVESNTKAIAPQIIVKNIIIKSQNDLNLALNQAKELTKEFKASDSNEPITALKIISDEVCKSDQEVTMDMVSDALLKEGIADELIEDRFSVGDDYEVLSKDLKEYQKQAAKDIKQVVIVLSIIRATLAGSISAISYTIAKAPLETIIATTAFVVIIAGGFQFINDYYKNWINHKPFWAKFVRIKSPLINKIMYEGYKFGKETMLILGYLFGLSFAGEVTGYSSGLTENSLQWLFNRFYGASLSAMSEGVWVIIDAHRREQLLNQNYIQYQTDKEYLLSSTKQVLMKSQLVAIILSAITTTAQVLNITNNLEISNAIFIGLTVSGITYYSWKCINIVDLIKKISTKALLHNSNMCSKIFSWFKL